MKDLIKLLSIIMVGTFVFTACEKDVVLTVPGDATIDLGEEFDPMDGVKVDGADLDDVTVSWNPKFDNTLVNHYVATYSVNGESAQRNVYVRADKLAGTYVVNDVEPDWESGEYTVTVVAVGEYNELRFDKWLYEEISLITGVVNGDVITIPSQDFVVEGFDVNVQGTGTYDGEAQKILQIEYTLEENGETYSGTSYFQ